MRFTEKSLLTLEKLSEFHNMNEKYGDIVE